MPADLARATSELFHLTVNLAECPAYIKTQVRALKPPMSKLEGTIECLVALWDVGACEELPAYVRMESERLRQTLWRAAYVRGKSLEVEVAAILYRSPQRKPRTPGAS